MPFFGDVNRGTRMKTKWLVLHELVLRPETSFDSKLLYVMSVWNFNQLKDTECYGTTGAWFTWNHVDERISQLTPRSSAI